MINDLCVCDWCKRYMQSAQLSYRPGLHVWVLTGAKGEPVLLLGTAEDVRNVSIPVAAKSVAGEEPFSFKRPCAEASPVPPEYFRV